MATDTTIPESTEGSGGFLTGSTVGVRQLDDKFWVTLQPLVYQGKIQRFVIPRGHRTDFASAPRPFVWFLPRYGRYTPVAARALAQQPLHHRRDAVDHVLAVVESEQRLPSPNAAVIAASTDCPCP